MMFDKVSEGLMWKKISQLSFFREHHITGNEIKKKFECIVRSKFNLLYKDTFKNGKTPVISDVIYKSIFREDLMNNFLNRNIISK